MEQNTVDQNCNNLTLTEEWAVSIALRNRGFFIAYLRCVSELLDSGLFGIDRDSTLLEKALINQAVNQTNRVLLIRILSSLEGCSTIDLLNECSSMDKDSLNKELERLQKFPIVS